MQRAAAMRNLVWLLLCVAVAGCTSNPSSSTASIHVSVSAEPAGANCAAGGQRIDVTDHGATTTSYVCNGGDGGSASVSVSDEPPGSNCPAGGKAITTSSDGATVTSYVCNGSDGNSVIATAEPPGANCASGGTKIVDSTGSVSYVCNGQDGQSVTVSAADPAVCPGGGVQLQVGSSPPVDVCSGVDGQSVTLTAEPPGAHCPDGGVALQVGSAPPEYACNGSSLTWTAIAGDTQAIANAGYLSSATTSITLTLPASTSLQVGDELELLVQGTGDVDVAPNPGQALQYGDDLARWAALAAPAQRWSSVASSSDGSKLFASVAHGGIYTSADSGATWTQTSAPSAAWSSITCDPGGTNVVAAVRGGGIYLSGDAGATWRASSAPSNTWATVSFSAGNDVVAGGPFDLDMLSTDRGSTWTALTLLGTPPMASSIVISSDAHYVFTAGTTVHRANLALHSTWQQVALPTATWSSIACSLGCLKVVASASDGGAVGGIYTSADHGTTWVQTSAPPLAWTSVASSSDGTKLVAVAGDGLIYRSADAGATWTPSAGPEGALWISAASSSDGSRLVLAADGGDLYQSQPRSGLLARTGSALDLVYAGSDAFFVASAQGTIVAP